MPTYQLTFRANEDTVVLPGQEENAKVGHIAAGSKTFGKTDKSPGTIKLSQTFQKLNQIKINII